MLDNPYQPPAAAGEPELIDSRRGGGIDKLAMIGWPLALVANLVLPVLFSWAVVKSSALIGVALAVLLMLAGGWCLCYYSPFRGRTLLAGSILTALLQVFPIAHFLAGLVAVSITFELERWFGVGDPQRIMTALGAFFCTLLTGAFLASLAALLGWCCRWVLPKRWFGPAYQPK